MNRLRSTHFFALIMVVIVALVGGRIAFGQDGADQPAAPRRGPPARRPPALANRSWNNARLSIAKLLNFAIDKWHHMFYL